MKTTASWVRAVLFAAIGFAGPAHAGDVMSCRASRHGMTHLFELGLDQGKVSRFSYKTFTNDGVARSCEISATRGDEDSAWTPVADGVSVDIRYPFPGGIGDNIQKVDIRKYKTGFKLRVLSRPIHYLDCAPGGAIAESVAVVLGRNCEVQ